MDYYIRTYDGKAHLVNAYTFECVQYCARLADGGDLFVRYDAKAQSITLDNSPFLIIGKSHLMRFCESIEHLHGEQPDLVRNLLGPSATFGATMLDGVRRYAAMLQSNADRTGQIADQIAADRAALSYASARGDLFRGPQ